MITLQKEDTMSGLETIYYIFTNPAIGIKGIQENRPVGWAFFVIFLAAVSTNVGGVLITPVNLNIAKAILSYGLLARVIFIIGIWIVGTALIHLFAEWFDGEGRVSTLFTAVGFSSLPAILIAPFALSIQNCSGTIKILLFILFNLIILIWIVRLQIIAIKEIYHVSTFRAMMIISTPATLGILGIISLLMIGLLMSFCLVSSSTQHLPASIFP